MLTFFFIPAKQLNAFFVIFLHKQIYVLIEKTDNLASLNYYKPAKKEKKEENIADFFIDDYKVQVGKNEKGNIAILKKAKARDICYI